MTDASGNVINQTQYKAWGETRYASGSEATKYQYTGQYSYANDFGLLFYNARFYDPSLGRFTSADTIVPAGVQGYDRYAYVNNSPINYTDPSGHFAIPLIMIDVALTVAVVAITAYVYSTPEMQELGKEFSANFTANFEDAVENITTAFAEETQPLEEDENESPVGDLSDILMPGGQPIGKDGHQGEHIREVGEGEVSEIWEDLSEVGTQSTYPGYDGEVLELENGDIVGLRDSRKHGPTIDIIKSENLPYEKIHGPFKPKIR